jgi:acyl-homoserine lactone acylase PvdQ
MKKIFWAMVVSIVGIVLLLIGVSFVVGRQKGRDIETLKIEKSDYSFEANRNPEGYWHIKASNPRNLGFAMGYLQMHDREFQLEMIRKIARGEMASVFGEKFLNRDRVMRFSKDVSLAQYKKMKARPTADEVEFLSVSQAFVDGVNEFKNQAKLSELNLPVEYEVFRLDREMFESWSVEDLFSVARMHTWEFSYDYREDLMRHKIQNSVGSEKAFFLLPSEPQNSESLYGRPELEKHLSFFKKSQVTASEFSLFEGPFETHESLAALSPNSLQNQTHSLADDSFSLNPWGSSAGSNAWLFLSGPKKELTYCNDTHLAKQWPSALFPVSYEVESHKINTLGYALPGMPWSVIGQSQIQNQTHDVHGIVLANYADVQDLVQLSRAPKEGSYYKLKRLFKVRNPETGLSTDQVIEDKWYKWGPMVDSIYELGEGSNVVLDWMGFRQTQDPSFFFYKKQFSPEAKVEELLAKHFQYPAVQYSWARLANNKVEWGHMVTGGIFEHKKPELRASQNNLLNEQYKEQQVRVSTAWSRPYLKSSGAEQNMSDEILLALANQKVFDSDLSGRLALHWLDTNRSGRIYELKDQIASGESLNVQEDVYSKELHEFYRSIRRQFGVDHLCSQNCYNLFAELDSWKGQMNYDSKAAAVVALFYENLKWLLWPSLENPDSDLYNQWRRSLHSRRFIDALVSDIRIQEAYQKEFKKNYSDLVKQAFKKTLSDFDTTGGVEFGARWGHLNRKEFLHPFAKMPAPVNDIFTKSLLGSGVPENGFEDTLNQNKYSWDPARPLEFKSNHGPSMKFCSKISFGGQAVSQGNNQGNLEWNVLGWQNSTGSSGRPFSRWSKSNYKTHIANPKN